MPRGIYDHYKIRNKNRIFTEKHKENIKKNHHDVSGKNNPMYGKNHSEKTKKIISNKNKGRINWKKGMIGYGSGNKNPNWKGGISLENNRLRTCVEFRLWREAVFARDGWTCRKCGDNRGGNLQPHHIFNFAEHESVRYAIDNGITLCKKCHTEFHKGFGFRHNNLEEINNYLHGVQHL
jgi:ribosomal protein L37AE/L43A